MMLVYLLSANLGQPPSLHTLLQIAPGSEESVLRRPVDQVFYPQVTASPEVRHHIELVDSAGVLQEQMTYNRQQSS